MSVCTFIAADIPLAPVRPPREYPLEINIDDGTVYDGGADDNFFLFSFTGVSAYTDKKYGVSLEWEPTDGRAERICGYIKTVLEETDCVELWHVWLMDYYELEDRPLIHKKTILAEELTVGHIREISNARIWNRADKHYPDRPSFYCLTVLR